MSAAEQLRLLHDLQQIDQQIMEIELLRKNSPKEIEVLESEMEHHRQVVKEKEAEQKHAQEIRRQKDRELQEHEAQIEKNKARLMAVKTNEEYHAIQRENDKQKEMIEEIEDQLLRVMDDIDGAELSLKKAKDRLVEVEKLKSVQIVELNKKLEVVGEKLKILEEQRAKFLPSIEGNFLHRYDRLREITGGVAVVRVIKRTCQGCLMNVPPQVYNLVIRNEEIITCPSCHRILFYEAEAQKNEANGA